MRSIYLTVLAISLSAVLFSSKNLLAFGVTADFTSNQTVIMTGDEVDYTNQSTNASTYEWTFEGGDPAMSTATDPQNIKYSFPGSYDTELLATDIIGLTDTELKTNYITVNPYPDDIRIDIVSPMSACDLGTEEIKVAIWNLGSNSISQGTSINIEYSVDGGTAVSESVNAPQNLNLLDSFHFVFNTTYDFSSKATYQLEAEYTGSDDYSGNNTSTLGVTNFINTIATITEDFDGSSSGNPWQFSNVSGDDFDWTTNSGGTISGATGPNTDNSGNGNYVYIEASNPNFPNKVAYYESPCLDLTAESFPFLEFYYHMRGADMGTLSVEIFSNTGWNEIYSISGEQHGNINDPYAKVTLDLKEYSGDPAKLRFKGVTGNGFNSDIAIDDIRVFDSCDNVFGGYQANVLLPDSIFVNSPTDFYAAVPVNSLTDLQWFLNEELISKERKLELTFNQTGADTLKLVVESCTGFDTATHILDVVQPTVTPQADFVASKNSTVIFDSVRIEDLSDKGPTQWEYTIEPTTILDPITGFTVQPYNYVNNTDSTSQDPWIRFLYPGKYTICSQPSNSVGQGSKVCKVDYITVLESINICAGLPQSDVQNGYLYDDGGENANYSNNTNCSFLLNPCSDEIYLDIEEFHLEEDFDFLRIYDGSDANGTPLWDVNEFGPDGLSGDMATANIPSRITASSGSVFIEFDTDGSATEDGFKIRWSVKPSSDPKPVANFNVPDTVCQGIPFSVENISAGDIRNYVWTASENAVQTGESPTFVYFFTTGIDSIQLVVDACGGKDTVKKAVYVANPSTITPEFEGDILNPNLFTDVVTFTDQTRTCADGWEWEIEPSTYNFVNGTDEFSQNPQVVFNQTGSYDVKLIASYGTVEDSINKPQYINVIDYCTPTVLTNNSDLGISRVQIGMIDNSSLSGDVDYQDFTSNFTQSLARGLSVALTLQRPSNLNDQNVKVWIDYNVDGDFDDPGEQVISETNNSGTSYTDSFVVPMSASLGFTRMRIGTNVSTLNNTPCGTNRYGEYEDYRIKIVDDAMPPVITLDGDNPLQLEACDNLSLQDTGAIAFDNVDGNLTTSISVVSNVDTATAGNYTIEYRVTDVAGNEAVAIRDVIVISDTTSPQLSLNGQAVDTLEVLNAYSDPGFMASDNCSGMDTVIVSGRPDSSIIGDFTTVYRAVDEEGNETIKSRTIKVLDLTPPNVALNGNDTVFVEVFNSYSEDGVMITDTFDNSPMLEIQGMVDTAELGEYRLDYLGRDASGNESVISRIVIIGDTTGPMLNTTVDDTIILDVNSNLDRPFIDVVDNYFDRGISSSTSGSFYDEFPNEFADELGEFVATYTYSDPEGNSNSLSFTVQVVDREDPEISLIGSGFINIDRYDQYEDEGVSVTDNFDTNVDVDTSGSYYGDYVGFFRPGIYDIVYTATDQSGNQNSVTRFVNVADLTTRVEKDNPILASIYPNPGKGPFTLELKLDRVSNVKVSITDVNGKLVKQYDEESFKTKRYIIHLDDYPAGSYHINIRSDEASLVKRLTLVK